MLFKFKTVIPALFFIFPLAAYSFEGGQNNNVIELLRAAKGAFTKQDTAGTRLIDFLINNIGQKGEDTYTPGYVVKNNRAAKAVRLLEIVKDYMDEKKDTGELKMIEYIQRNVTKKHIVLDLYTVRIDSVVEQYLGDVEKTSHIIPLKVKSRVKNEEKKSDKKKSRLDNFNELQERFKKDVEKKK